MKTVYHIRYFFSLACLCLTLTAGAQAAGVNDSSADLVDVTQGTLYDGWGRAAVKSLSTYYGAQSGVSDVQMLDYRSDFLPAFDWVNGRIETDVGGDLYDFYASGGGTGRVQYSEDPAYAFSFAARYQEPAGRPKQSAGAGYALGMGAPQTRLQSDDYQNWSDADIGSASGVAGAGLENMFNTQSSSFGFSTNLTAYTQKILDTRGASGLSRQAWQATGSQTTESVWAGKMVSFGQTLPSNLVPPQGVEGSMSAIRQRLLGNYFAGDIVGQSGFSRTEVLSDVLGQWTFGYDPNLAGSAHVFRDDLGRTRFFRNNGDLSSMTSQGFRYIKYDAWGRVAEVGVLLNVAKSSFSDYAQWARQADLDEQLTSANSCPVFTFSYDADPVTGSLTAYDERRGAIAKRRYYTTAIDDQPTACPGRATADPVSESLYQYDDLGRTELLSEHRQTGSDDVYRTTVRQWPSGGLIGQVTFPDKDQSEAFDSDGQGSVSAWPDVMGRGLRLCSGADCSGTIYSDVTQFDWTSSPLLTVAGNGVSTAQTYDLRGRTLSTSASLGDVVLFAESLRDMQIADDENPCPGSTSSPDYAAGLIIARALSGSGLPEQDQDTWECYSYDGAARLSQTSRYQWGSDGWQESATYSYSYDDNSNVESISTTSQSEGLRKILPGFLQEAPSDSSFARDGSDQLNSASLASGEKLFSYESSNGQLTEISDTQENGFSLTFESDTLLHLPLSQTVQDKASGDTVLSATITYDAQGMRASRTVSAGSEGKGSSNSIYRYGGLLFPILTRDGADVIDEPKEAAKGQASLNETAGPPRRR
jgi:hypothetical protein